MKMELTAFECEGRAVWLAGAGGVAAPLVLLPDAEDAPARLEAVLASPTLEGAPPFVLAAFASEDWNRDYTPWPAPAVFKKEGDFAGGGPATFGWMKGQLLPAIHKRLGRGENAPKPAILGYSLAGLFSLWAFYESGLFSGCASCSGSLWYPGWGEYLQSASAPAGSRVYLSLGEAEEKARNPVMATVGAATRAAGALLEADPHVEKAALRFHPGGHFNDPEGRLAQGLAWLVAP